MPKKSRKKKEKKKIDAEGVFHIRATFNNTIINVTSSDGSVIAWCSPGAIEFKGSRKNTPFAAQRAAEEVAGTAYNAGMRKAEVHVKGAGNGREGAIRAISSAGIKVTSIKDFTSIPHNGCRPPKRRRV